MNEIKNNVNNFFYRIRPCTAVGAFLILWLSACGPPEKLDYATVAGSGSINRISDNITILFNNPPENTLIDNYLINMIYETADDVDNGRIPEHTHLDVCLYDFNRNLIIEALEYAISKNVHVRFVGDMDDSAPAAEVKSATYSGNPGYRDLARALDSAYPVEGKKREEFPTVTGFDPFSYGMTDFRLINSSGIMHNKFVLIQKADGKYLYCGSMNASDNDILRNNNNALVVKNDDVFAIYKKQFEYMLGSGDPVHATESVMIDGVYQFNITFAYPAKVSNYTHDIIRANINNANFNIYFMIFSFFHDGVASAMAGKSDIDIAGIFDESQISGSKYYNLKSKFQCRIDGNENADPNNPLGGARLHHKVMIVDRGYSGAKVITGSSNWSVNANSKNDENTIVIQSKKIADIYFSEFEKRWAEAKP